MGLFDYFLPASGPTPAEIKAAKERELLLMSWHNGRPVLPLKTPPKPRKKVRRLVRLVSASGSASAQVMLKSMLLIGLFRSHRKCATVALRPSDPVSARSALELC